MSTEPTRAAGVDVFASVRAEFEQVLEYAKAAAGARVTHGDLERGLSVRMREVTRAGRYPGR